jgi:hypothetical protein
MVQRLKTILCIGQSNMEGFGSFSEVASSDFSRWTGDALPGNFAGYNKKVTGINYWTYQKPSGPFTDLIADSAVGAHTTTQISMHGGGLVVDAYKNKWVICTSTLGAIPAGNIGTARFCSGNTATTLSFDTAWSNAPTDGECYSATSGGSQGADFDYLTATNPNFSYNGKFAPLQIQFYGNLDSGTASAGSTTTITDASKAWVVNQWIGYQVTIVGGTGASQTRVIKSNTATVLTIQDNTFAACNFSPAPINGSTYAINSAYKYQTGYDYSNNHTQPLVTPALEETLLFSSPDMEIGWQLRNEFDGDLWIIKYAIGSSYTSAFKGTILSGQDFSWFRGNRTNDFSPSSAELLRGVAGEVVAPNACFFDHFDLLTQTIFGLAQAWVDTNLPGAKLDVQGIFSHLGESEALDPVRNPQAGYHLAFLRDQLRIRIGAAGLTTLTPSKIPFIEDGGDPVGYPGMDTVNTQYKQLEKDDLYTGYTDSLDLPKRGIDPLHYTGQSLVTIGQRMSDKWREIRKRDSLASTTPDKRRTLADLRAAVKLRYEANGASGDATDARLNATINDAQREISLKLGDRAWYLKPILAVTAGASIGQPWSLPKQVRRVIRVERTDVPGYGLPWNGAGYDDQGRLRIIIYNSATSLSITHRLIVDDLIGDADQTVVPDDYLELLKLLSCRRLAETSGNAVQIGYWEEQCGKLWEWVMVDADRHERQRSMTIQAILDAYGPYGPNETFGAP